MLFIQCISSNWRANVDWYLPVVHYFIHYVCRFSATHRASYFCTTRPRTLTVYHQHHGRWILMLISRGIGQTRIKDKKKKKWRQNMKLPVKNIPPPKLGISCSWKYPEYVNFTEIFATFNEWPKFLKGPSKRDLARAGFIYTQIGDKVTCFSCGMTLKNWEPLDDAYNEHLRWAKCCPYAKMVTDGKLLRG